MKNKFLKGLVASFALAVSGFANAGLIEADYLSVGDNLAVFDDTTGLTWLDLSVTAPFNTIDAVEAQFSGYTVATTAQILDLFSEFSNTFSDMNRWYGLFGHSELNGPLSECGWEVACSYGKSSQDYIVGYGVNTASVGFYASQSYTSDNYVAYFMVKNEDVVDVPEPSTLAVFALGLMGLASRKFKKKS